MVVWLLPAISGATNLLSLESKMYRAMMLAAGVVAAISGHAMAFEVDAEIKTDGEKREQRADNEDGGKNHCGETHLRKADMGVVGDQLEQHGRAPLKFDFLRPFGEEIAPREKPRQHTAASPRFLSRVVVTSIF